MKKRYAIVRVDNTWCPNKFENVDNRFVCDSRKKNIKYVHCERCLYGDTKEQLIRKVAQVMLRKFIANYLTNGIKPKLADEQIQIVYKNYLELAKEIVEFLGVE